MEELGKLMSVLEIEKKSLSVLWWRLTLGPDIYLKFFYIRGLLPVVCSIEANTSREFFGEACKHRQKIHSSLLLNTGMARQSAASMLAAAAMLLSVLANIGILVLLTALNVFMVIFALVARETKTAFFVKYKPFTITFV